MRIAGPAGATARQVTANPGDRSDAPQNSARPADEHERRADAGRFAWAQGPVKSTQSNRP